jgi:hypothetical protein
LSTGGLPAADRVQLHAGFMPADMLPAAPTLLLRLINGLRSSAEGHGQTVASLGRSRATRIFLKPNLAKFYGKSLWCAVFGQCSGPVAPI